MKKMIKSFYVIIALFTMFFAGNIALAQTVSVDWNVNNVEVINEVQDKQYFQIMGKITEYDGTSPLFLKLYNTTSGIKTDLIDFTGRSAPLNFSNPSCNLNGNICTPIAGQTIPYTAEPGNNYFAIITNADGETLESYSLGTIPIEQSDNVVTNIIATPKSLNGKNYYEIKATINETKLGKSIVFIVFKDGTTSGKIIGDVEYSIADVIVPTSSEIQNIGSLSPGQYSLEIREIGGDRLQELVSIPNIPTEGSNESGGTQQTVGTTQNNLGPGGLVGTKCGYNLGKDGGGRICGFADFISLIQRVIEYIFVLILPIAAIVFAYAGFLYITSGGSDTKRTAAKKAMTNLVIGIVVIMMAWLVVKVVLTSLGVTDGFTMFLDL